MKRNRIFGFIFLLAGGLLLTTCQKEKFNLDRLSDEVEIHPQIVAPLIFGSMTMTDITELFDSVDYIGEFEGNLIYFAYSDTVVSVVAGDELSFLKWMRWKSTWIRIRILISWLPVPVGDTANIDTRVKIMEFEMVGDNRLDEVLVKGGSIELRLDSTFKHSGKLTISSNEIWDQFGE